MTPKLPSIREEELPEAGDNPLLQAASYGSDAIFGVLQVNPVVPMEIDLSTIGTAFQMVDPPAEPAPESEPEVVTLEDTRTAADLHREAMAQVANLMDIPEDVIHTGQINLQAAIASYRDYVMTSVVPVVLAIEPALQSVTQMVPKMFHSGGTDLPVTLPVDVLKSFAGAAGMLAARLHILEMLNLPEEAKLRILRRLTPEGTKNAG